jgi:hypothetical protein
MARLSLGEKSRFAGFTRAGAVAALLALLVLIGWGLAHPPTEPSGQPGAGDAALYRAVAVRVADGETYHQAAATEQRLRGYPLRPFTAMRPPALARIGALLGPQAADLLLVVLALAAAAATGMRLFGSLPSPVREAAVFLGATGVGLVATPGMWVWHELWAGLLVALALSCRSDKHWGWAVAFGLAAALIRELALPFLPIMAGMAALSGRRREAAAWSAAALVAVSALAWHALLVGQVARSGDPVSPGWLALGGWSFDLVLARHCALLLALPAWVTAVALPLALLGWAGWRNAYAVRVTAMLAVWLGAFLVMGRPDNDYWGFLLAPLLPIGLALAPAAVRDLLAAAGAGQSVMTAAHR